MENYCTAWPDGWPKWMNGTGVEWAHCCKIHDEFYANQLDLNLFEYLGAHFEVGICVAKVSPLMGVVMLVGLATLGLPYIIHRHNRAGRIDKGQGK